MADRTYFKNRRGDNSRAKLAEAMGADYYDYEEELAVFICPDSEEDYVLAIALDSDRKLHIGTIDEGCDNFEHGDIEELHRAEAAWLVKTLTKLSKEVRK